MSECRSCTVVSQHDFWIQSWPRWLGLVWLCVFDTFGFGVFVYAGAALDGVHERCGVAWHGVALHGISRCDGTELETFRRNSAVPYDTVTSTLCDCDCIDWNWQSKPVHLTIEPN